MSNRGCQGWRSAKSVASTIAHGMKPTASACARTARRTGTAAMRSGARTTLATPRPASARSQTRSDGASRIQRPTSRSGFAGTGSRQTTTDPFSNRRVAAVRSVVAPSLSMFQPDRSPVAAGCTSTTATMPAMCGESYAHHATSVSASSEMIQRGLRPQFDTCDPTGLTPDHQAIRRCYRFGQARPVDVRVVVSDLEQEIALNVARKQGTHSTITNALAARNRVAARAEMAVTA